MKPNLDDHEKRIRRLEKKDANFDLVIGIFEEFKKTLDRLSELID